MAHRAWFRACLTLGRLLRGARYAQTHTASQAGECKVRKHRLVHAPLLVWAGGLLVRILDTGVRVLQQRDWEERERRIYRALYDAPIRIDPGGVLVLPCLPGRTLAALLEDPELAEPLRQRAIELSAIALVEFHARGFTHGDAMAENVMVDLDAGVARWFDFETLHDTRRGEAWCRADDVRALLTTCVRRAGPQARAGTLHRILDACGDEAVTRLLAMHCTSPLRRALAFHLGQAPLSWQQYREIGCLLDERLARRPQGNPGRGEPVICITPPCPLERLP